MFSVQLTDCSLQRCDQFFAAVADVCVVSVLSADVDELFVYVVGYQWLL